MNSKVENICPKEDTISFFCLLNVFDCQISIYGLTLTAILSVTLGQDCT